MTIAEIHRFACNTFKINIKNPTVPKDYPNYIGYESLGKIDSRNFDFLRTTDEILKDPYCSCYDSCFFLRDLFNEKGIENHVFYSCVNDLSHIMAGENIKLYIYKNNVTPFYSHAFIIYKQNNKWKWFEYSWAANVFNNWAEDTIEGLLTKYKVMAESSWHYPIISCNIDQFKVNCPRLDFFNKAVIKMLNNK